jgi:hypothetical protein
MPLASGDESGDAHARWVEVLAPLWSALSRLRAGDRPARDRSSLAPRWISIVLASEIQTARRETDGPA